MRRGKTIVQQAKFYEVEDFCVYLIEVFANGNFQSFEQLYKELSLKERQKFIDYVRTFSPKTFEELSRLYGIGLAF